MRRLLMFVPVALGVVALGGAALVPAAGAQPETGSAPLTIKKEVKGPVPKDTEFTVTVECNTNAIFNPSGPTLSSAKVDFDSEGEPDGSNVITFVEKADCKVVETEDGDAEDVSYECEGQISQVKGAIASGSVTQADAPLITDPCSNHGPTEDPITYFVRTENQSATVEVTNEFPEPQQPPAAQPVAGVAPTFTG